MLGLQGLEDSGMRMRTRGTRIRTRDEGLVRDSGWRMEGLRTAGTQVLRY